jgi:hypothetical protein
MKAYGSIPHLLRSNRGPADHGVNEGQDAICTRRARDERDLIVVQEKLDGSCVAIVRREDSVFPLTRKGFHALTSPWEQHRMFADWVVENRSRLLQALEDDEWLVGEWLAQAHGTRYRLPHEPFVAFDLFQRVSSRQDRIGRTRRLTRAQLADRLQNLGFSTPHLIGFGPMDPEEARMRAQRENRHEALDPLEGVVYRVERDGEVDFLAKYVRPGFRAGRYLKDSEGAQLPPTWNWYP